MTASVGTQHITPIQEVFVLPNGVLSVVSRVEAVWGRKYTSALNPMSEYLVGYELEPASWRPFCKLGL